MHNTYSWHSQDCSYHGPCAMALQGDKTSKQNIPMRCCATQAAAGTVASPRTLGITCTPAVASARCYTCQWWCVTTRVRGWDDAAETSLPPLSALPPAARCCQQGPASRFAALAGIWQDGAVTKVTVLASCLFQRIVRARSSGMFFTWHFTHQVDK